MSKKYNLIVPLAGKGQRMIDGGYKFPKPLIWTGDRHVIEWSMDSIDTTDCDIIFVVRKNHVHNFAIDKYLRRAYGDDVSIVVSDGDTGGAADSCLLAEDLINNDKPLIVYCPDIYFEPRFTPTDKIFKNDGFILTFKANSTNYSYVQTGPDGFVTRTAEKVVISEDASVGVYCFKTGRTFVSLAKAGVAGKESYICPLYNLMIAGGGKVRMEQVPTLYVMGTPEEMKFFKDVVFPYFLPRGLILCSDHSGFEAKERMKSLFIDRVAYNSAWSGETPHVLDVGCYSDDDCDYADYIKRAVETQCLFPGHLILGFCRSGQGVNICANKHNGIRSVLAHSGEAAELGIRHNAANFFAVPAGHVEDSDLLQILKAVLLSKFEGGRHQNRLQKLEVL